jgi:cell fate regulator YaaT (PSP1 superfamily)
MPEVVSVCFRRGDRSWYFDPGDKECPRDSAVIVETSKGPDLGWITRERFFVPPSELPDALRPVLRLATETDLKQGEVHRAKEADAFAICARRIAERNMPMRLVEASYAFDGRRVTFTFASETRVDFRDLVRDLVNQLHTRVELLQVGVRDQARIVGGFGSCGRELCCRSWLREFRPTAIRMAKEQGLSLNPTKVSGLCGRLLCCLRYEYDTYVQLRREAPARGTRFESERGIGKVLDVDVIQCTVQLEHADGTREWCSYRTPAAEAHNVAPPAEDHIEAGMSHEIDVLERRFGANLDEGRATEDDAEVEVPERPSIDAAPEPPADEAADGGADAGAGRGRTGRRRPRRRGGARDGGGQAQPQAPAAGPAPAETGPAQPAAGSGGGDARRRRRRRGKKPEGGGA